MALEYSCQGKNNENIIDNNLKNTFLCFLVRVISQFC